MVEQEVETVPPWLIVVIIAALLGILILIAFSGNTLSMLITPFVK